MIAVLSGLGKAILPLMDFVGGQLYKYGGYYAVYGTSLSFTVIGIFYIILIPESVTRRAVIRCHITITITIHTYITTEWGWWSWTGIG